MPRYIGFWLHLSCAHIAKVATDCVHWNENNLSCNDSGHLMMWKRRKVEDTIKVFNCQRSAIQSRILLTQPGYKWLILQWLDIEITFFDWGGTYYIYVIFWPSTRPKNAIPRWYTGRKWHIPMASNRKRSRGRIKAYDMGQGEGPIVPLTVMKRVTSELHDSYFRLMTIKHPIQRSTRRSCGRWIII